MTLTYLDWNEYITQYFFNEEKAGKNVILFVNKDIIDEIGEPYGEGFNEFVQCLVEGPDFVCNPSKNICITAHEVYSYGEQRGLEYPPYIAYLALFVCAATIDGDYDSNAYYPRLKDLVGDDPDINMSALFSKYIDGLWTDLQRWSQVKTGEAYGRFTKMKRGGHAHVGIIYAQTIISEKERNKLPIIFLKAGLDPTDPPTEDVLKLKLRRYGELFFETRTKRLLDSQNDKDQKLLSALIDLVLSELERWDGTVPETETTSDGGLDTGAVTPQRRPGWMNAYARVCLSRAPGGFSSSIRFKFNLENENVVFPERGLELKLAGVRGLTEHWLCGAAFPIDEVNKEGWSRRLQVSRDGRVDVLKADLIDWSEGAVFVDKDMDWRVVLRAAEVRVFLPPGRRENIPDTYVEAQHLERNCQFLVACHDSVRQRVVSWGERGVDNFVQIPSSGLPRGWSLFRGENAKNGCSEFEPLALPTEIRLRLFGGVRLSAGSNCYLHFAPPTIFVEGSSGDVIVTANGEKIPKKYVEEMQWDIPSGYSTGDCINIDVLVGDKKACNSRTIQLVEPEMVEDFSDVPVLDANGKIVGCEGGLTRRYARGAVVYGVGASELGAVPLGAPTYLSDSITFLGPEPGMVVRWPNDALPTEWSPVWALAKTGKRTRDVHYCGLPGEVNSVPKGNRTTRDQKKLRSWRESVWVNRNRNRPPRLSELRRAWSKYTEVARDV